MTIHCYLNFNGNCNDAIEFYGKVFDAVPKIMTFGEMPGDPNFPLDEEMKKLVMHANLIVDGNMLMFSDVMPDMKFLCGNNISLSLSSNDKEKLTLWFNRLAEGGEITMPLEATFWSELYGFVTDKFGIGWQLNYSK